MKHLVIPTRTREELPEEFAYALWPDKVTEYLEGTPQRDDAELAFRWRDEFWESHWRQRIEQHGIITLARAVYTPDYSPYFPKWRIDIYSVPKEYLTPAQEILFDGGMEKLAKQMAEHGLTPDYPVKDKIQMNLADWDHDETRLTPEQLSEQPHPADEAA